MLKHLITLLMLAYGLSAFAESDTLAISASQRQSLNDSIIDYSKKFIGCPYKSGGKGPSKFDCSGFTGFVFAKFGYKLNASSGTQYMQGKNVKRSQVTKGDLVFFAGRTSKQVGHVGIVCETDSSDKSFSFIHASTHNGVMIDKFTESNKYYYSRYIGARRVLPELSPNKEEAKDTLSEKDRAILPDSTARQDTAINENESAKSNVNICPETHTDTICLTVKKGETLYKISRNHDCPIDSLKSWNRLKNNSLSIGQKLIILKNVNTNTMPEKEAEKPEECPAATHKTHIVKKGDTLYRISKQNKCSIESIKELNKLNGNNLKIGSELQLPIP